MILGLLLSGVLSSASVTPFMAVYIVETLGQEPMMISVYAALTLTATLLVNRQYGEWIDNGRPVAHLVLASLIAFLVAVSSILVLSSYWSLIPDRQSLSGDIQCCGFCHVLPWQALCRTAGAGYYPI